MRVGALVWFRGRFLPGYTKSRGRDGIRGVIELNELPDDPRLPDGASYGVRLENGNYAFADDDHVRPRMETP